MSSSLLPVRLARPLRSLRKSSSICAQCSRSRRLLSTQSAATSRPDADLDDASSFLFDSPAAESSSYDPATRARGRKKQLPSSRYTHFKEHKICYRILTNPQIQLPLSPLLPWPSTPSPTPPFPRSIRSRLRPGPLLQPTPRTNLQTDHRPRLHDNVLPTHASRFPTSRKGSPSPSLARRQPLLPKPSSPRSPRRRRPPPPPQTHRPQ